MSSGNALLLLATILLLAAGQVGQKFASRAIEPGAGLPANVFRLLCAPAFWISILMMVTATIAWLILLTGVEISRVYPVLGLSFAVTALLSRLVLRERISGRRWVGIGVVTLGAAAMMYAP